MYKYYYFQFVLLLGFEHRSQLSLERNKMHNSYPIKIIKVLTFFIKRTDNKTEWITYIIIVVNLSFTSYVFLTELKECSENS